MSRLAILVAAPVLGLALLAGCGSAPPPPDAGPSASPTAAKPVPAPREGSCHDLDYDQAVAPTADPATVPCSGRHTSQTYAVGRLDRVVDGHLLAVDSQRVQDQVSAACPAALGRFLGGSADDLRLSMIRAVWFTPTIEEAAAGADWYRCDVVAVSGSQTLEPLHGSLAGVLGSSRADDYALCGTAKPGTSGFLRVACSADHSWRAISVVDLPKGAYPGEKAVTDAGEAPCKQAAQDRADNALDYEWGYDWPSAEQWAAGQTYGVCWAPD